MATAETITRRINTAEDLRSIVRTMKALAAVNIRQYEEATAALADYADTVALGFQALLHIRPETLREGPTRPTGKRVGAIVLGSDHGLCGAFNERVATFYLRRQSATQESESPLIALGARVAGRLEDLERRPDAVLSLPASAGRIAPLVLDLLERIARWRDAGTVDTVRLYFNAPRGQAGYQPREQQVLPFDDTDLRRHARMPWRPRAWPTIAGDWDALFSVVVQQHLFVTLHRAVAQSLAAENASRLAAMHTAERNITERLDVLRGQFHRERQAAITTELLDIVSGYEALTATGRRKSMIRSTSPKELPHNGVHSAQDGNR